MPRFFVQRGQIEAGTVTLLGDDAHHISRSLRMAAGERITVCDMQKTEYECELTDFLPDRVLAKILENSANANGLKGGSILSRAVYGFVVFFCTLVAVENLGIASQIVNNVAAIILASFGLAFAIAVGLGARPLVEEYLRGILEKKETKNKNEFGTSRK